MHKIQLPITYRPNITTFYRKERKSWVMEYNIPTEGNEIRTRLTLPKSIQTQKQVNDAVNNKRSDLTKGILSEKEFIRFIESKNVQIQSFDKAIQTFLSLPDCEKTEGTKKKEARILRINLKFFEESFNITEVHRVKEDHVFQFKEHLLLEAQRRTDLEAETNAAIALSKTDKEKWDLHLRLKKTGMAPSTARSYFKLVKTFFTKLHRNKKLALNPAENIDSIQIAINRKVRTKSFDFHDVAKILNASYVHPEGFPIKEFFELKLETGARLQELLCLEWNDFDSSARVWHLRSKPTCPTPNGIGFKPKWGKERTIPLSNRAIELLQSIPRRKSVGYTHNDSTPYPGDFVFTSKDYRRFHSSNNQGWYKPNSIKTSWSSLLKHAGLEYRGMDKHQMHDLRRFRNEIDRHIVGLSDEQRSRKLGHSTKVNKEHYSANFDQTVINMNNEIKSLQAKILLLQSEQK